MWELTDRSFDPVGQQDVDSDGAWASQLLGPFEAVMTDEASTATNGRGLTSSSSSSSTSSVRVEIHDVRIRPAESRLDKSRHFGHRHAEATWDAPAQVTWCFRRLSHGAENVILSHDWVLTERVTQLHERASESSENKIILHFTVSDEHTKTHTYTQTNSQKSKRGDVKKGTRPTSLTSLSRITITHAHAHNKTHTNTRGNLFLICKKKGTPSRPKLEVSSDTINNRFTVQWTNSKFLNEDDCSSTVWNFEWMDGWCSQVVWDGKHERDEEKERTGVVERSQPTEESVGWWHWGLKGASRRWSRHHLPDWGTRQHTVGAASVLDDG